MVQAMKDDSSYAHSWKCNIQMPIYDMAKGKLTIHEAEEIADRLMKHLFEVKIPEKPLTQSPPVHLFSVEEICKGYEK